MAEYPHGHVTLLNALEEYLDPPEIIVIRGNADEIVRWQNSATKIYAPTRLAFAVDENVKELPGLLVERKAIEGETVAYRCVGTHCELPIRTLDALVEILSQ